MTPPDRGKQERRIGRRTVELSSLDKVLFPDSGLTKGDLVDHYERVAEVMLPHLKDRPLSLQRFPDGIGEDGFYQKDRPDHLPDWIDSVTLPKKGGEVEHVVANDAATLVYLANLGCVTFHVGMARRDRPEHPDRLIFDLDPPEDAGFDAVRRAARWLRELLAELDVTSFPQTTGSRGLHVVVALDRSAEFDAARELAHDLADVLAGRHPDALTTATRKDARDGRLFVDYLRNAYGQTAVAPYAVRPRPGAPVATPLGWDELGRGDLNATRYTITNLPRRLANKDDPWKGMDRHAVAVSRIRRDLDRKRD